MKASARKSEVGEMRRRDSRTGKDPFGARQLSEGHILKVKRDTDGEEERSEGGAADGAGGNGSSGGASLGGPLGAVPE